MVCLTQHHMHFCFFYILGTARRLCLRPQIFKELSPSSISKNVTAKTIVLSPAMSHYFQARRGPFTPGNIKLY